MELLIVIGILAVLAALSVGGYMRIKATVTERGTKALLSNRATGLNAMWTASRDAVDQEFRDDANGCKTTLTAYCGDPDRAKAVYLYMRSKADFPQTFFQAANPVELKNETGSVVFSVPAKRLFTSHPVIKLYKQSMTLTAEPVLTQPEWAYMQSAALIYLTLTERGTKGVTDDVGNIPTASIDVALLSSPTGTPAIPAGTDPFKAFADGWGNPMGFVRWATNADIQSRSRGTGASKDPYDSTGLLVASSSRPWPSTTTSAAKRNAAIISLFAPPGTPITMTPPSPLNPANIWQSNWLPTLISMGQNQKFLSRDGSTPYNLAVPDLASDPTGTGLRDVNDNDDDLFSYRLGQNGN